MEKKIELLTFHCVPNYGAVLQAYGLQYKLSKFSKSVAIVDYRPPSVTQEYSLINTYSIFSVISSCWSMAAFLKKKKKFTQFEKEYLKLVKCKVKDGILHVIGEQPDVLFLGSDQIWNPDITHGFDKTYFGKIYHKDPMVVASYAASIGKNFFNVQEKEQFSRLLNNIKYISVREKQTQQMIQNEFHRHVEITVDPTILAGRECFEKLVRPVAYHKYLLVYSLTGMSEVLAMAKKIAKYFGYKLIELSGRRRPILMPKHKAIFDAGPEEFVSLFYNAEYIVTDSFHGSVFSILFHKPFITLTHKSREGRIFNLLKMTGLSHRCIEGFKRSIVLEAIEWESVDEKLEEERKISIKYIKSVLERESNAAI